SSNSTLRHAHVGKCHEVPILETSPVGPFDRWPSPGRLRVLLRLPRRRDRPVVSHPHEGTGRVEPWAPREGYHLTEDLADKAIAWVRQHKVLTPDKPFFLYFAPAPHTLRTTFRSSGPNGTGTVSTTVGTCFGSGSSRAEGTRRRARGCRTHPSARRDSRLGRDGREVASGPAAADGELRGVPRAHRPPGRSRGRGDRPDRALDDTLVSTSSATTARRPRARSRARPTN
ncbi:sulfatase-like hydrolase/transferase, partial [Rhodococcus hoagii]|nr:sulfatase-like hydrolase/transferase [Prescottella equi]